MMFTRTSLHYIFVAVFLLMHLQVHACYYIISGPVLQYADVYRSLRLGACVQASIVIIPCIYDRHFEHL
jgi:hypothetical protein